MSKVEDFMDELADLCRRYKAELYATTMENINGFVDGQHFFDLVADENSVQYRLKEFKDELN